MKWFKRKKTPKFPNSDKSFRLERADKEEMFDVGSTVVRYELVDGRALDSTIYGTVEQYRATGGCENSKGIWEDFSINDPHVYSSLDQAKQALFSISDRNITLYDNTYNPTKAVNGVVKAAKILKTHPHVIKHKVYYAKAVPV